MLCFLVFIIVDIFYINNFSLHDPRQAINTRAESADAILCLSFIYITLAWMHFLLLFIDFVQSTIYGRALLYIFM